MARGGKREGAGRPKGAVNETTKTLREKAREHADDVLAVLIGIAKAGESDAARVAACNALLDRGYGKASTVLNGDEDGGPVRLAAIEWNVRDTRD
jgi:hypothetical protein